jgi:signal transduction histidine kinase
MSVLHTETRNGIDSATILSKVLTSIVEAIAETNGQAQILSPVGKHLFIVASTRPEEIGLAVLIDDSVSGQVFKSQEAVIIPDVQESCLYKNILESRMRSEIAVPLPSEGGVINVESPKLNAFKESHIAILKKHAERVYESLPGAVSSMAFDILLRIEQEIEQKIAGRPSQDVYSNICAFVCEKAQKLIGAEHMQLLLVEEDGEHLGIIFSSYPTDVKRVHIGDSVSGQAVLQGRNRNVPDVREEKVYHPTIPETMSELVVVAREGQKVLVVVNAESPRLSAFTKHQETLLELFAQQAARAWRHLQFGMDMERMRAEKRATQTLVAAADIMGNMVHGYQNKFSAIDYWRRFIRDHVKNRDSQIAEALEEIAKALSDIEELPDRIREKLAQAEKVIDLDVNEVVREALAEMKKAGKTRVGTTITLDLRPEPQYVSASVYGLTRLVENLVKNALDATASGGTITVETTYRPEGVQPIGPCVELTVRDTGRGMSEATKQRIFDPGWSTKPGSGMGFGLFWVKLFVDRFRGEVRVDSALGEGTTVSVLLPIASGSRQNSMAGAAD